LPVSTPEECSFFKDFDFLTAAERNAEKLPGFDMGNSPFEFLNPLIEGKKIAFKPILGN
jgi:2-phosphosulfolactate phosphatase